VLSVLKANRFVPAKSGTSTALRFRLAGALT
jgi:hypothetical protein